jgi:hypothetical protein
MERATIYRSLSAPTALVGGLLSFGGLGLAFAAHDERGSLLTNSEFLAIWLVILALTSAVNGYFLWREAKRRGHELFSAGMKCALRSVLPSFLCAGVATVLSSDPVFEALFWILFYGLGLLAMQHFAPRSIVVLGWTFVAAFIALLFAGRGFIEYGMNDYVLAASWMMALTFGLFHIIYAIAVWALGEERASTPVVTSTESGNV